MVKLSLYLAPTYYRVQGQGNKVTMMWYDTIFIYCNWVSTQCSGQ